MIFGWKWCPLFTIAFPLKISSFYFWWNWLRPHLAQFSRFPPRQSPLKGGGGPLCRGEAGQVCTGLWSTHILYSPDFLSCRKPSTGSYSFIWWVNDWTKHVASSVYLFDITMAFGFCGFSVSLMDCGFWGGIWNWRQGEYYQFCGSKTQKGNKHLGW